MVGDVYFQGSMIALASRGGLLRRHNRQIHSEERPKQWRGACPIVERRISITKTSWLTTIRDMIAFAYEEHILDFIYVHNISEMMLRSYREVGSLFSFIT